MKLNLTDANISKEWIVTPKVGKYFSREQK